MHPLRLLILEPQLLATMPSFLAQAAYLYLILFLLSAAIALPLLLQIRFPRRLFLLHFLLYLFMSISAFDFTHKTFFVPGDGINIDSLNILSSVEVSESRGTPGNIAYTIGQEVLNHYPTGSTHLISLVSRLSGIEPYSLYHRTIVFFYLLILFPAYLLVRHLLPQKRRGERLITLGILIVIPFHYLALHFINTSVLGSTLTATLVFTWLTLLIINPPKITRLHYCCLVFLTLAAIYLYSYYALSFFIVSAMVYAFLYPPHPTRYLKILAVGIIIALIIPTLNHSLITPLQNNLTSTAREAGLFAGMLGHTTGFVNPLISLSLWISQPDPRDLTLNDPTLIAVTAFCLILLFTIQKSKIKPQKSALLLLLTSILIPLILLERSP